MAKVCISGNYGRNSLSDELELVGLIAALRQQSPDCEIVVFSDDSAQTEADFDVKVVENKFEIIKAELNSSDLLIVGGGNVLKETADLTDLKNYLRIIKTAQRSNIPVFVYHQTISEFTSPRAKSMVAKVMQKVRKITVADEESAEHLKEMGIRPGRIHVVGSPLLLMDSFDSEWNISLLSETKAPVEVADEQKKAEAPAVINYDGMEVELEIRIVEPEEAAVPAEEAAPAEAAEESVCADDSRKKQGRGDDLKSIVPSFWKKPGEKFASFFVSPCVDLPVEQITVIADEMAEKGYCVVFLPLNYLNDIALIKEIRSMMKNPSFLVDAKMSPLSILTAVQETDFVFTAGTEGLLAAVICDKPFASLCVNAEMTELEKALGVEPTAILAEYNGEAFIESFRKVLEQPEVVSNAVSENLPALRESSETGIEQLTAIFEIIARRKAREARGDGDKSQTAVAQRRKEQVKNILGFDKIKGKIPKLKGDSEAEEAASGEEEALEATETEEILNDVEEAVETAENENAEKTE